MPLWGVMLLVVAALFWLLIGIGGIILTGKPKYERFLNTNEKSRDWLLRFIKQAKDEVRLISGNFNPRVYDRTVADAMREKLIKEPWVTIHMLAGPEIFTLEGVNEIFTLAEEQLKFGERLMIQFLAQRPLYHFRVVDTTHLYVEDPHDPKEDHRMVSTLENSFFKGWQYRRAFERRWQEEERVDLSRIRLVPIDVTRKDINATQP